MAKYKCPEGDFEQDGPGVCPNHGLDLVEETEEGGETKAEVETEVEVEVDEKEEE